MTAREEFNQILNSCAYPRAVYNAFMSFAASIAEQKPDNPHEALLNTVLEAVKEGESK